MLLLGLSLKAQAPANTVLWSENWGYVATNATPAVYLFSDFNATVVYGSANINYQSMLDDTKLYNTTLAGGSAPELLLAEDDTFSISGIPTGNASIMTLSYKSNNAKANIISPTEGIAITKNDSKAATYTYTITNDGKASFDLYFTASGNTRLDDIKLTVASLYTLSVATGIENGTISLSHSKAATDETITVTANPDEGYILESLYYNDGTANTAIDVTTKQFAMPAANITVGATFTSLPNTYFQLISENLSDWSGKYIVAYAKDDENLMALDGCTTYGTATNIAEHIFASGIITANDVTLPLRLNIEHSDNGYTIHMDNVGYLGLTSDGNNLNVTDSVFSNKFEWTITHTNDTLKIANSNYTDRFLQYNANSPRFACYKGTQKYPSLYKFFGEEQQYTITVDDVENGTVNASAESATTGEEIVISATPNDGYELATLTYVYDGVEPIDIKENLTFSMPAANVTVNATFSLTPTTEYSITIADGIENGTVETSAETATEGTEITVTTMPAEGFALETLTYVYGEEEPVDIKASKSFEMPAANVTINATFAEMPEAYFAPVTENLDDWTGEYIMAYPMNDDQLLALNRIIKVGSNYVGDTTNVIVYLSNGLIEANNVTTAIRITVEKSENGYTLNLKNNGFLGWLSGNTMVAGETADNTNYEWTLNYANDTMKILNVANETRMIKFNTNTPRFAAYSTTSSVQTSVTLYKYFGEEILDDTYTLTVAENIENGTIELSAYEAVEGTNITVTPTPDNGYVLDGLTYTYDETAIEINLETMTFTMPAANVTVCAVFVSEAEVPAITNEILPMFIQGKDGTNNNRLPFAYRVTISHLMPNATYRYVNQAVTNDDNTNYDGVGNMIYANCNGDFVRTTSNNLTVDGSYGEFTTDGNGEYTGWFITETTANNRFTPGNNIYMRIRINDGNDGTTAKHKLTTSNYATVINFGDENEATLGTAIVGQTNDPEKSFVFLYDNAEGLGRPIYGTPIENTGVDYTVVSQYATFYQNQVSGRPGFWGGIIPNTNQNGVRYIGVYDNCTGEETNNYICNNGNWNGVSTVNPVGDVINLNLTNWDNVCEENMSVNIWNHNNEIIVDNNSDEQFVMTVYNILGQPVMNANINSNGLQTIRHTLTQGLYIINISNRSQSLSSKIVVR